MSVEELNAARNAVLAELYNDPNSVELIRQAQKRSLDAQRRALAELRESRIAPADSVVTSQLHGEAYAASLESHRRRARDSSFALALEDSYKTAASDLSVGCADDALVFESLLSEWIAANVSGKDSHALCHQWPEHYMQKMQATQREVVASCNALSNLQALRCLDEQRFKRLRGEVEASMASVKRNVEALEKQLDGVPTPK